MFGRRGLREIEGYYFVQADRWHIERQKTVLLAMRSICARNQQLDLLDAPVLWKLDADLLAR